MPFFFFMISGGDEALSKSERIKRCMKELDAAPRRTFYVGDTTGDVNEAHEAGVSAVGVTWGMHPAERLEVTAPNFIMRSPEELVNLMATFAQEQSEDD